MIDGSGRRASDLRSHANLSVFTDDHCVDCHRITRSQNGSQIMAILNSITDHNQRRQLSGFFTFFQQPVEPLQTTIRKNRHLSGYALVMTAATEFRESFGGDLLNAG